MRIHVALLLAVPLAGCDLDASAEADTVCVTQVAAQRIPGFDTPSVALPPIPVNIGLDLGGAIPADLNEDGVSSEIVAQSITLSATPDQPVDLAGIASATLTVSAAGRPPVAFRYERPAGAPAPIRAIAATPERPVNLVDYLEDGQIVRISQIQLSGAPPTTDWTPTVRTCGSTRIDVDYLDAL
jgi:hypothetical protein